MRWDPLLRQFLVYPGGGDKGSSTTVNQMFSPEEAARRTQVMDAAAAIFGSQPASRPPTGATPDTVQAQERLRAFSTGQGQQLANTTAGAVQFGLADVLYPQSNPAMQEYLKSATRNITEAYQDPGGVLSQIRSNFASQDGRGSREAIALGLAEKSYLNTIGDVTSKITSDAYGKGLDTFSRTMAFAPNAYNLAMQPAVTQDVVGQQIEGYSEQQRQWEANSPWANLQNYANIVFGGSAPGTQTTSMGPGTSNVQRVGMALGGATLGYQIAAGTAMGGPYGAAIGAAAGLLMSMF